MGKRKAKTKPAPKKRMDKLDTVFSCPFCNHGSSVECRIDMKNLIGEASCGICQESFSTTITALSEPIDIYSEWIDECERVNNVEDDDILQQKSSNANLKLLSIFQESEVSFIGASQDNKLALAILQRISEISWADIQTPLLIPWNGII
ncbi:Transcription elongation factor 1-like protein, partial [Mucuna pruriens]